MKYGESIDNCLKRELEEEIGIIPTKWEKIDTSRVFVLENDGKLLNDLIIFSHVVTEWQNDPILSGVEGEYFWKRIDKIEEDVNPKFEQGFEVWLKNIQRYLSNPDFYVAPTIEMNSNS